MPGAIHSRPLDRLADGPQRRPRHPRPQPGRLEQFQQVVAKSMVTVFKPLVATHFRTTTSLCLPSSPEEQGVEKLSLFFSPSVKRRGLVTIRRIFISPGPDIIKGEVGPAYPKGLLGWLTASSGALNILNEAQPWIDKCYAQADRVAANLARDQGGEQGSRYETPFRAFNDFFQLYASDHFAAILDGGPYRGIVESGGTDDAFAIARLSCQPFVLRRLRPGQDKVPFAISDSVVVDLTDELFTSVDELLTTGRLFYVDYRLLTRQTLDEAQYTAATETLFFQDPQKGDALSPLAIRMHPILGKVLQPPPMKDDSLRVFTPLDDENDWALAKMVFSQNDLWFGSIYHLACTHNVLDVLCLSAVRNLSPHHPIFALLMQVTRNTFGIRPAFLARLFVPGGPIDTLFPFVHGAAGQFAGELWHLGEDELDPLKIPAGRSWAGGFFRKDLENRGLLSDPASHSGPPLPSFPFYQDVAPLLDSVRQVIDLYLRYFYHSDSRIGADHELSHWLGECSAALDDFPVALSSVDDLVDLLCHACYLSAMKHNVLNGSSPSHSTAILPWHPASFYHPLPTSAGPPAEQQRSQVASAPDAPGHQAKVGVAGILDRLLPYLPTVEASTAQIALLCAFNRPDYRASPLCFARLFEPLAKSKFGGLSSILGDRSLFDATERHGVFLEEEERFREEMKARSGQMQARLVAWTEAHEAVGRGEIVSGHEPFAWTLFDPLSLPGYAAI